MTTPRPTVCPHCAVALTNRACVCPAALRDQQEAHAARGQLKRTLNPRGLTHRTRILAYLAVHPYTRAAAIAGALADVNAKSVDRALVDMLRSGELIAVGKPLLFARP